MTHRISSIALATLAAAVVACEADEPHVDQPLPDPDAPVGELDREAGPEIDPQVRIRLADRLDRVSEEMDRHTTALRIISPEHFLRDRELHRERVERFVEVLAETLVAAHAEAPSEEAAARALGLQRGRHRALADEVSAMRAELRHIETLSAEEVPEWLPAHVDRLNRLIETARAIAAHLRR